MNPPMLQPDDDLNTLTDHGVCPRCRQKTVTHGFNSLDGHWLETHHCQIHGDVAPLYRLTIHHHIHAG